MLILIFGEDGYRIQKRMRELKTRFKEKYGEINISDFKIDKKEEIDISKIISEIKSVPFLSEKRLVTVKGLLQNSDSKAKELVAKESNRIPESSIVIFYEEGVPKKNEKIYKQLLKIAKIEEYQQPKGGLLLSFIRNEADRHGASFNPGAAERLAHLAGGNTWRLSLEIEKLSNYAYPNKITIKDVDLIVSETLETKIFDLVDDLARRDGNSVLLLFHNLLKQGEKKEYLFSMIVYSFRNLVLVKYLKEKNKNTNESQIAKKLALHPFVAKKAFSAAEYFTYQELKSIYKKLVKVNLEMHKSNNDPVLTLDLFLSEICTR